MGDTGVFMTGLESLQPAVEAGETSDFVASMSTLAGGSFESTIHFHFSDENLPGANQSFTLSLTLTGSVDDLALGDFDNDGDVDGRDFLVWQRDPNVGNLADWQNNYGAGSLVSTTAVPEPSSLSLCIAIMGLGGIAIQMTLPEPNAVSGALCISGFSLIALSAAWDWVMEGRFWRPVRECTPVARRIYWLAWLCFVRMFPALWMFQ